MHKLLSRQLKRSLGIEVADIAAVQDELSALARAPGLSPRAASVLTGLGDFFERVDLSYQHSQRDLELRTRSLELSSEELGTSNARMREELASRARAIESLRDTVMGLMEYGAAEPPALAQDDLESLSVLMGALVRQKEATQKDLRAALTNLAHQKFALDQHAIVSMADLQGRITYANDKFCAITGYSHAELMGKDHRIVNSGVHDKAFIAGMWDTILSGRVWHGEMCNRSKAGALFWTNATLVPLLDDSGQPAKFIAIRTDITDSKRMEATIQAAEARLRKIANTVPGVVFQWLASPTRNRFTFVSPRIHQVLGLTTAAALGDSKAVFGQIVASEREAVLHAMQDAAVRRVAWQGEYMVCLPNDTQRFIRAEISPDADRSQGDAVLFTGIWQDVTASQTIAAELQKAKDDAVAASRAKSDFLANMSHEIRTPMNGVLGMADLMLDSRLDVEQREYVGIIKSSADALLRVINDILDFSKIEAGKLQIEHIPFHLGRTMEEIMKVVALRASDKGLLLASEIAPGVPLDIVGDPGRLRQVLVNLVGNAIKFTARGSITVQVSRAEAVQGSQVLLFSVRDTGIGIATEKLQSIFEPFSQEDSSTTRRYGGTGLGLTISARLVEAMGGQLWADSNIGVGSAFHFTATFQSADASMVTLAAPSPARHDSAVPPAFRALHVLLVEDNAINQKLAQTLLERWGHSVVVAENGQEALDCVDAQSFDAVLMDMMMPVMNGLDATRAIRARSDDRSRIPIIAMTANAMEADRDLCLEAGMNDYISKPIRAQALQEKLQNLVVADASHATHALTAVPAMPATDTLFDYAAGLRTVDQEILGIIAPAFVAQWAEERAQMEAALRLGDLRPVFHKAHALKGTLAMFGAAPASDLAAQLEALAQAQDQAGMQRVLPLLCAQVEALVQEVRLLPT